MDTNINICPNDCIVETNSNVTVEKGISSFINFDENNLKNILSGNYIIKNKSSNSYTHDLEYGNINNSNDLNNTQSDESSDKYVKNLKSSTIFNFSVNFIRYIIGIYKYHGCTCLSFYFLVIFWIIFIR